MNKNILMSTILLACGLTAAAQETAEYENVFEPHWTLGAQVGGQYTLGELSFGDLLSPTLQLSGEYKFSPVFGVRGAIGAYQSKAGLKAKLYSGNSYENFERDWKYNYIAPNVDLTVDLSNLICGYNPERTVSVGAFVGIGLNVAFSNDEANDVANELQARCGTLYPNYSTSNSKLQNLGNLWDGTKVRLLGRAGLYGDYRINDKWKVGLEVNANVLNDNYNSKDAGNSDWYFNALVGVKYTLGKTHSKRAIQKPEPQIVERVVERVVEKPVEKVVEKKVADALRVDVFFTISSTKITASEQLKVKEMADYLKKHPDAKVEISGYADKGTGNSKLNMSLSEKRANIVAEALQKLGISSSRITKSPKGDNVQPYSINDLNRVSICIAQ